MGRSTFGKAISAAVFVALLAGCGGPAEDELATIEQPAICLDCEGGGGGGGGTPLPACTYTYSAWTACNGTGVQTRTVVSWSPSACSGTPVVSRSCISYDVGVIAGSTTCGAGVSSIVVKLDNENNNPMSMALGWTGANYVDAIGNTFLHFCRADGRRFAPLIDDTGGAQAAYDYAVLKLGTHCPNGSTEFGRFFDNQDNDFGSNPDTAVLAGNVAPSYVDGHKNFMMRLCIFRYAGIGVPVMQQLPPAQNQFPALGYSYGVFAGDTFVGSALPKGLLVTDDEDHDTLSRLEIPAGLDVMSVRNIIDGDPYPLSPFIFNGQSVDPGYENTVMRIAQVASW